VAKKYSFPWPVLGNGSDVEGSLGAEIIRFNQDTIQVSVNFTLDNATVAGHIAKGKAEYLLRVHCGKTYFRRSFRSPKPDFDIEIPFDGVRGVVKIESFIVVCDRIHDYRPDGLHEDYGKAEFCVEPGQILALGPSGKMDIDKDFDPLINPANSIIKLTPGGSHGVFEVNYEDDYIIVAMSKEDWAVYQGVKARTPHSIMAFFALPVLAEAIRRMIGQDAPDLEDHLWYKRISDVLRERKIEYQDDPLQAAQVILEAPVSRALQQLDSELAE
jgi:hypothetical protein